MFGLFDLNSGTRRIAAAALASLMLAGCASQPSTAPADATASSVSEEVMTVESVNATTRQAVLATTDGKRIGVTVSEDAGSLAGVSKGDLVQVLLLKQSVARLAKASDLKDAALGMSIVGQRDDKPARDDMLATRQVVEVVSVTLPGDQVRYKLPDGSVETILVENGENRAFARSLQKGDRVVIDTVVTVNISTIGKN